MNLNVSMQYNLEIIFTFKNVCNMGYNYLS